MSTDHLITNFDYLARVHGVQAFNECGERILTDDEIIELILPNYLERDPWGQYAMCLNFVGIRKAPEFYAKIQEVKNRKENNNGISI
jgi:hypothetical protein